MRQIDLGGVSVMIAMPVKGAPTLPTTMSLIRTVDELARRGIKYDLVFQVDGNIEYARSKAAYEFRKSDYHRLFWIDADMAWTIDDFMRILALSMKMDIIGAPYTARCDPPQFFMGFPAAVGAKEDCEITIEGNEWGCIEATGYGAGFFCCSRYAIEKVSGSMEPIKFTLCPDKMPHIFDCDIVNGEFIGEDMAFFARARNLGIKVWFDPNLTLGHVGSKTYSASFREHMAHEQVA
jgi:hypothetical protein